MAVYRTSQGRMVDMASLAAKNEKVRAVGNMKVNARGDIIDGNGNIIEPVNEKVNNQYAKTVGNRSAIPTRKDRASVAGEQARSATKPSTPPRGQLTESELELEDSFADDLEIEKIKAKETKRTK